MTHTTKRSTRPTLLGVNHDGPIRVSKLGEGHQGLVWTVQPENHQNVIDMINDFGGPDMWEITPLPDNEQA